MSGDLLLVIDVGNTNTVLGVYEGERLVDHWRVATDPNRTTDELGVLYLSLFRAAQIDPARVGAAICACVVPPVMHGVRRAAKRFFGVEALFVGSDVQTGVLVDVVNPREVGADRIVNALAANAMYGCACIVVDFGTATTFDVVGADGTYGGGVIAPGLGISLEALHARASKLPRVEIVKPDQVIGRTTITSMQSGIVYGYVGLVDGIVERIREELPDGQVKVVATGGLASLIAAESRSLEAVEPFLTLEGLRLLHVRNPR